MTGSVPAHRRQAALEYADVINNKEITAMARIANFAQFSDTSFDLGVGGDIDRTLTRTIESPPVSGEGALLTWNVRREGSGSVTYEVKVNDVLVAAFTVTLGDWSAVQEALSSSNIHVGSNTVEFRVTDGTGILSIGDVVLFFREDI
jgi:hypothetical protein